MTQDLEFIRDNIVKIVDENKKFHGTGFLIAPKYVVTCHHCLATITSEIYVERDGRLYHSKWNDDPKCIEQDIAFLRIIDPSGMQKLEHAPEAYRGIPVFVWGYSGDEVNKLIDGAPIKTSLLGVPLRISWGKKMITGNRKWNVWPPMRVSVYRLDGKFDRGYSGAPVCYTEDYRVVGMFNARDENYGYIIPIEFVLKAFSLLKRQYDFKKTPIFISKPSKLNSGQNKVSKALVTTLLRSGITIAKLNKKRYRKNVKPLFMIKDTMTRCAGVIVLGFMQTHIIKGRKNRSLLKNSLLPTPWNNIEATIAYMLNLPVLIIKEEGVSGGIFDAGMTDFPIHQITISAKKPFRLRDHDIVDEWLRDLTFK